MKITHDEGRMSVIRVNVCREIVDSKGDKSLSYFSPPVVICSNASNEFRFTRRYHKKWRLENYAVEQISFIFLKEKYIKNRFICLI